MVRYRRALAKDADGTFRVVASDIDQRSFEMLSSCKEFVKWIDGLGGVSITVTL